MNIMGMLWQLGVLAAVLVFGFKLGFASGLSNMSKKLFTAVCASYGAGVLIIAYIASFYAAQITEAIYSYNSLFYILMAAVMIAAGLITIREWKVYEKNARNAYEISKTPLNSKTSKIILSIPALICVIFVDCYFCWRMLLNKV